MYGIMNLLFMPPNWRYFTMATLATNAGIKT
jgi:hypothetical protein